jgi:uncharacterized protein involved in response to NO
MNPSSNAHRPIERDESMLHIQESAASEAGSFGLWGRAFRPFFLGLAIHTALALPWWILVWLGWLPAPRWLIPMWWHGHEMMFGFVAAAIAGFLLTASPVWSGGPALRGGPLAALFALWISGRIALAAAGAIPAWLVAGIDFAFLPAVALAVVRTLWGSGQRRNYAVVGIVVGLAIANGSVHAEALGLAAPGSARAGLRFAVDLVVVLLLVIGGRITPAFTQNALRQRGSGHVVHVRPWAGALAIAATAALALTTLLVGRTMLTGLLATLAGVAAAIRLAGWRTWQIRSDALLWSLHAGAAWLVVGLLLVGASDLGAGAVIPAAAGLHALTAGAMGASILAVITRVGLGHTGRPLVLPRGVHVAVLARVAGAFFPGEGQRALLVASALAWAAAFGFFAVRYWPILTTPRPDGRPG